MVIDQTHITKRFQGPPPIFSLSNLTGFSDPLLYSGLLPSLGISEAGCQIDPNYIIVFLSLFTPSSIIMYNVLQSLLLLTQGSSQ